MAYIGRSPEYGNAVSQQITGTNSVGPYSLSYDTSTSGVVISLDGVVQRNSVDFNIVGTALTFTSTVGTGIIINVVFTGLTLSFPTPSDGSVTDAKITAMAASKLTGTIADARFPATLPAASGVNLTALNATNLGSGTVPTARLGSGTASSSTFLRGDQTYAAAGGGKVLQVVSTVKTDAFTSTATSYTAITGMSLAITPSATSSKVLILIRAHFSSAVDGASAHIRFYRDSTNIGNGDAGGSSEQCMAQVQTSSASDGIRRAYPSDVVWLDSPSSTSAVTYSLKLKSDGNTSVFNRTGAQGSIYGNFSSSIVLMEIDA